MCERTEGVIGWLYTIQTDTCGGELWVCVVCVYWRQTSTECDSERRSPLYMCSLRSKRCWLVALVASPVSSTGLQGRLQNIPAPAICRAARTVAFDLLGGNPFFPPCYYPSFFSSFPMHTIAAAMFEMVGRWQSLWLTADRELMRWFLWAASTTAIR